MMLYAAAIWFSEMDFPPQQPMPSWEELKRLLSSWRLLCFFFSMFIMGMGLYVIGNFLFLFLEEIGADEFLMGLSLVFTVSTEIPFFFVSSWALRVFGVHALLVSAMVSYVLRYAGIPSNNAYQCKHRALGYSFLTSSWWVLPLELLHGLTFGATWAAGIENTGAMWPRRDWKVTCATSFIKDTNSGSQQLH